MVNLRCSTDADTRLSMVRTPARGMLRFTLHTALWAAVVIEVGSEEAVRSATKADGQCPCPNGRYASGLGAVSRAVCLMFPTTPTISSFWLAGPKSVKYF